MACFASFQNVCIIFLFVAQVACFASFQNVCIIFLFVAQMAWFPWRKKKRVCVIVLFIAQVGLFGTSGGQLGFWLEGLGGRLGILWDPSRLGSFGGSLFFLGLWEHPKFRGSLFFGTTLEWNFASFKGRPLINRSIRNKGLGFTASSKIAPWIKFNSIEWNFYFYLAFYFYKLFEFLSIAFESLKEFWWTCGSYFLIFF